MRKIKFDFLFYQCIVTDHIASTGGGGAGNIHKKELISKGKEYYSQQREGNIVSKGR
jgi:hypothetical protein